MNVVQERVAGAKGLPDLLDASYGAFEAMLVVIREHDDPGDDYFVPMVLAGASAASGRDHMCWAPSLPQRSPYPPASAEERGCANSSDAAVAWLGELAGVLENQLGQAAFSASDQGDRAACRGAARRAREVRTLMGVNWA